VWGTLAGVDNIVWGTDCGGADCDNIVWGTFRDADNIVWGTAEFADNIVWGTSGEADNIVWGTSTEEGTSWGNSDDEVPPLFEDPESAPASFDQTVFDQLFVEAPVSNALTGLTGGL
jgi:hypothetical protein